MHLFGSETTNTSNGARPLVFYVIITCLLFLITFFSFPSKALTIMSGELDRHLKSYNYGTKADNRWVMPSAHDQLTFEKNV
ncbi:hypothetical protein [Pseudoalteromonas phenolica]|uniref:hypothetical protein n=1 Tax=Pseudoalteromonas phenolica TaxID=161398 RepID=UPI000FFE3E74|nr:hypothetical protein [Pseudoalteromonas phenolica]RXF01492.1 hypothetical protein D9981_08640 [Pseudoalteromonas phenolica O-BC30]